MMDGTAVFWESLRYVYCVVMMIDLDFGFEKLPHVL